MGKKLGHRSSLSMVARGLLLPVAVLIVFVAPSHAQMRVRSPNEIAPLARSFPETARPGAETLFYSSPGLRPFNRVPQYQGRTRGLPKRNGFPSQSRHHFCTDFMTRAGFVGGLGTLGGLVVLDVTLGEVDFVEFILGTAVGAAVGVGVGKMVCELRQASIAGGVWESTGSTGAKQPSTPAARFTLLGFRF